MLSNVEVHFYFKREDRQHQSRGTKSTAWVYGDQIRDFWSSPSGSSPNLCWTVNHSQKLEPCAASQLGLSAYFPSPTFYYNLICLGSFHSQRTILNYNKSNCFNQCFNHQVSFNLLCFFFPPRQTSLCIAPIMPHKPGPEEDMVWRAWKACSDLHLEGFRDTGVGLFQVWFSLNSLGFCSITMSYISHSS